MVFFLSGFIFWERAHSIYPHAFLRISNIWSGIFFGAKPCLDLRSNDYYIFFICFGLRGGWFGGGVGCCFGTLRCGVGGGKRRGWEGRWEAYRLGWMKVMAGLEGGWWERGRRLYSLYNT